jgi:DNA-directed RNA polymerase specialized sigma subunit
MDKNELSEIVKLRKEVKRLQDKLAELQYGDGDNETVVSDKVRGSMSHFPYSARSFNLVGWEQMSEECIKKRNDIAAKISNDYYKLSCKINKAIDYINTIEDSELRTILNYRYIDGLTEEQTAEIMGITDRTVRRKIRKWANKNKTTA